MKWNIFCSFHIFFHYIPIYPPVNYNSYGKLPCFMDKSTISMAIFNSYVSLPEGNVIGYPISNIPSGWYPMVKVNPIMGMLSHWLNLQGGAPQITNWLIIPLTVDISATKTIVIGVINAPTERYRGRGHHPVLLVIKHHHIPIVVGLYPMKTTINIIINHH